MNWYYAKEGQPTGPVSEPDFAALVQAGSIGPTTLVWHEGLPNWTPYQTVAPAGELPPLAVPPVAAPPEGQFLCAECRRYFPPEEVIQVAGQHVCAGCKPLFVQKIQEGVTPAIALPNGGLMALANFWPRFGAFIIDGLIIGIVNMVLIIPLFFLLGAVQKQGQAGLAITIFFQLVISGISIVTESIYQIFFLNRFAATPGKMAFRLAVVRSDGARLTLGRCVGRAAARVLSGMICYIGYLLPLFDREKRALHDHICDTRVIVKPN
jgi:uncharacterized RDD family membrane protein YckC